MQIKYRGNIWKRTCAGWVCTIHVGKRVAADMRTSFEDSFVIPDALDFLRELLDRYSAVFEGELIDLQLGATSKSVTEVILTVNIVTFKK